MARNFADMAVGKQNSFESVIEAIEYISAETEEDGISSSFGEDAEIVVDAVENLVFAPERMRKALREALKLTDDL